MLTYLVVPNVYYYYKEKNAILPLSDISYNIMGEKRSQNPLTYAGEAAGFRLLICLSVFLVYFKLNCLFHLCNYICNVFNYIFNFF